MIFKKNLKKVKIAGKQEHVNVNKENKFKEISNTVWVILKAVTTEMTLKQE